MKRVLFIILLLCSTLRIAYSQTYYEQVRLGAGLTYQVTRSDVTHYNGVTFRVRTCTLLVPCPELSVTQVSDFVLYNGVEKESISMELKYLDEMIDALTVLKTKTEKTAFYNLRTKEAYAFKASRYSPSSVYIEIVARYTENGAPKERSVASGLNADKLIGALEAVKEFRDSILIP